MIILEGHIMLLEDVIVYIMNMKRKYPHWDFDDITGGIGEFVDKKEYNRLKEWYKRVYE